MISIIDTDLCLTSSRLFRPDTPYMIHIHFLVRLSMSKSGIGRVGNTKVLRSRSWGLARIPLIISSTWPGWIPEGEVGRLSDSRDLRGSRHWGGSEGGVAWFPGWVGEPVGFGWLGLTDSQLHDQNRGKGRKRGDIPIVGFPHVGHGRPPIELTRVEFLVLLLSLIISSAQKSWNSELTSESAILISRAWPVIGWIHRPWSYWSASIRP